MCNVLSYCLVNLIHSQVPLKAFFPIDDFKLGYGSLHQNLLIERVLSTIYAIFMMIFVTVKVTPFYQNGSARFGRT